MFTKFKDINIKDEQMVNTELNEHALVVMKALDEGIQSLDDIDFFMNYLHHVGATHTKINEFTRDLFWVRD